MIASIKKAGTLRDQVVEILIREVRNGQFAPGERITEQGVAERLHISRTPIRGVLNQLTTLGLLQARTRCGYVVPSPTGEQIRQIIAVRMLLEPPAARMAALEYGAADVERISKAIDTATDGRSCAADFAIAGDNFRHALFDGISNQVLSGLITQVANHLNFFRAAMLRDVKLSSEVVCHQYKVRDAIASGDGDLVEELWRAYIRLTEGTPGGKAAGADRHL